MRMLLGCALTGAAMVGGYASVIRGWDEQVYFSSYPSEAQMRMSTSLTCVTPCVLPVGPKDEFVAVFSKPGYLTDEVPVRTRLGPSGAAGMVGNVVIGGVIGAGVDLASGASFDHCPNPVSVTLRKIGSKEPPADPTASCRVPEPVAADRSDD